MEFREVIAFERLMQMDTDGDDTPTPHGICRFLFDIISPHYQPKVGLDPCAGLDNRMTLPWWKDTEWITFEKKRGNDFFEQKVELAQVEIVLCNPPFSDGQARNFIHHIFAVVASDTPVVFICSTLYFVGNFSHSRDYDWLLSDLPITSFILPPRNAFPGVSHPTMITLFNMPKLRPFYAVPYEYLER